MRDVDYKMAAKFYKNPNNLLYITFFRIDSKVQ